MRALLVLARVSNLPTVWSNCLAAWLLGGGSRWDQFALICLGATLLYTGGMFLNDAVDQGFDRHYRPERPIVSGQIGSRTVWGMSIVWLASGWATCLPLGRTPALFASFLLVAIVLYDVVHKRTKFAPLLMASCRFLLYVVAASASADGANPPLLWRAAALAAYIVGLSYLARGESTGASLVRWTLVLLFVPATIAVAHTGTGKGTLLPVLAVQSVWTLWCLSGGGPGLLSSIPKGVAGLLAGIVLVDWLAVAGQGIAPAFIGLFLLALVLQRVAPAT
jgi:hypothetical protein